MTTRILAPSVLRLVVALLLVGATSLAPRWSFVLWLVWMTAPVGLALLIVPKDRRLVVAATFLLVRLVGLPAGLRVPLQEYFGITRPPSAAASDTSVAGGIPDPGPLDSTAYYRAKKR